MCSMCDVQVLSEVELCVERLVQRETVGAISHLLSSELSKLKHAAGRVTDVAKVRIRMY